MIERFNALAMENRWDEITSLATSRYNCDVRHGMEVASLYGRSDVVIAIYDASEVARSKASMTAIYIDALVVSDPQDKMDRLNAISIDMSDTPFLIDEDVRYWLAKRYSVEYPSLISRYERCMYTKDSLGYRYRFHPPSDISEVDAIPVIGRIIYNTFCTPQEYAIVNDLIGRYPSICDKLPLNGSCIFLIGSYIDKMSKDAISERIKDIKYNRDILDIIANRRYLSWVEIYTSLSLAKRPRRHLLSYVQSKINGQ